MLSQYLRRYWLLASNIFSQFLFRIILANLESSYRTITADGGYEYIGAKAHPVFTLEDFRKFHDNHGANPQLWIGNFGLVALSFYLDTPFWIVNSSEGGMVLIDMVPGPVLNLPPVQVPDDLAEVPIRWSAHLLLSHSHYQVLLTDECSRNCCQLQNSHAISARWF